MTILWILERAEKALPGLASALMGDYAVRAFASLESLGKLARLSRSQVPNALVIDWRAAGWSAAELLHIVKTHLLETPTVAIGECSQALADVYPKVYCYREPFDALALSAFIRDVVTVSSGGGQRPLARYRGLALDYERLRCWPSPNEPAISLPQKEAQLLRLFLTRPGQCLARAEIQAAIWPEVKVTPRTIDSHISRLRGKLASSGIEIQSVYGGGYLLR